MNQNGPIAGIKNTNPHKPDLPISCIRLTINATSGMKSLHPWQSTPNLPPCVQVRISKILALKNGPKSPNLVATPANRNTFLISPTFRMNVHSEFKGVINASSNWFQDVLILVLV